MLPDKKESFRLSYPRSLAYLALNSAFPFFWPPINRIKRRLLSPIAIKYIQISLTYECQCSCGHCGVSQYNKTNDKLTPKELFSAIDSLVKWGFGQIDFFGGEPLLDKNIYAYVRHASKKGIFTHLFTNGLLLSRENVHKLSGNGLSAISISFDSPDPATHDRNRNIPGIFEKALKGAEYCIQNKIKTIMSVYASESDILNGRTEQLVKLAEEKGFQFIRVLSPFKTGKFFSLNTPVYSKKAMRRLLDIAGDKEFVKLHGISNCYIPYKTVAYISPYGEVQPCSMVPLKFGSIRKEKLTSILVRMRKHPICNIKEHGCVMNTAYLKNNFFDKINIKEQAFPMPVEQLVFPPETNSPRQKE
ncbi:radical SAM protein [bacterium]|nr:MAG: radical SAM protein [bacterium]